VWKEKVKLARRVWEGQGTTQRLGELLGLDHKRILSSEDARRRLFLASLRLVVSTTKLTWKKRKDISFSDFIAQSHRALTKKRECGGAIMSPISVRDA